MVLMRWLFALTWTAGQQAAQAVAEVLPVGKAKIAVCQLKIAMKLFCKANALSWCKLSGTQKFRPDGIKSAQDYRGLITIDEAASAITWPYSQLNDVLRGLHRETLTTICAGSGMAKQRSARS